VARFQQVLAWLPVALLVVSWLISSQVAAGPCGTPESGGC
jgi:hypothetical protein